MHLVEHSLMCSRQNELTNNCKLHELITKLIHQLLLSFIKSILNVNYQKAFQILLKEIKIKIIFHYSLTKYIYFNNQWPIKFVNMNPKIFTIL